MPTVTIVIRSRNEEYWMRRLLIQLQKQRFKDYEVVLVDNKSTDHTREIFKSFLPSGKILEIENFKPGKAINLGIAAGTSPLAVILSAHCIPVHEDWLGSLVETLKDPQIGAAYGRQLPLPTSHPLDKRDLLNTFGIERRIQKKDTFFHNANSIIRREIWKRFPFDEETPHIEDRIWASHIINYGQCIAYEPEASVYHHHGINHHSDVKRAHAISDILTKHTLQNGDSLPEFMLPEASSTLYCFLGHDKTTHGFFSELVPEMVKKCPSGKYLVHSKHVKAAAVLAVEAIPHNHEDDGLTFVDILKKLLRHACGSGFYPDCLIYINLRLKNVSPSRINETISVFYRGMYDSVFFADEEYSNMWQKNGDSYEQLHPNFSPRGKKDPLYISRYGLGLATRSTFVENGSLVGTHVAILSRLHG